MLGALVLLILLQQAANVPSQRGVVEGVLRTSAGAPAAGVRVSAMVPPSSKSDVAVGATLKSIAQTDAQGRYRLEGIPPGRYYVVAGRLDQPTYYPGGAAIRKGSLVTLTAGATVSGVNFTLNDESVGRAASRPRGPFVLILPVSIQVEGGGKVPVFGSGSYPVLKLTKVVPGNPTYQMSFSANSLNVAIPPINTTEEYNVTVEDLPVGYAVKTMTHGSADILRETLKLSRPAVQPAPGLVIPPGPPTAAAPLSIILSHAAAPILPGFRVTGRSSAVGDDIHLSGAPGMLFSDGTFEFRSVSPGLYNIVKFSGTVASVAPVIVRDRDVDDVALQVVSILPLDVYSRDTKVPEGNAGKAPATVGLVDIVGQVVDATSQEVIGQGTITLTGYGNTRRTHAIVAGEGFRISSLLPGSYTLTVNVSDYNVSVHPVVVGLEGLKIELKATSSVLRQQ
jgi:hypothetical protein